VLPPPKRKFGEKLIKHGRSWLAQIRPPWSKSSDPEDISVIPPVIPPVTPRSPEFINETTLARTPKSAKYAADEEANISKSAKLSENKGYGFGQGVQPADDEYYCDPPPLYKKHPPEGGLKGWIAVAGAFLIQFCTIGFIFTWNVFEDYYNHVYLTDQNPIAVRFIGSVQLFFAFLLSVVAGKLMDSGYFRYVIHGGSVLYIVSLALLSFIGEEQLGAILACQSIGMGIGIGLVFVPTAIIPLYYFKRRKGLAMGIVISGGSLGGMIFPAVLRALLPSRGFRGAVLITACVVLGFLAVGNGLSTYSAPPKQEKPAYPLPRIDLAKYSKEMGYLFAAGGVFLTMLIIYFPVMYLNLLGLEKGVDANTAFNTIIILSLSGIFGRVGFGFASDFVGPFNLMIPISGFLALMMFTTCTIQGPKSLGAYAFFYGFFAGGWFSLMITALSSLALRKTEAGTRVGLVLSASSIAMLVSLLLQDGILTPNHVWAIPSAVGGVLISGVTALMYLSRMSIASKKQESTRRRLPMLKDMAFLKATNIKVQIL